jgi:anti-sigma B factor antagonist
MSHIEQTNGTTLIKPEADIVASSAHYLKTELLNLIQQGATKVIVDLQEIEMVDSTGLGVFIAAQNSLKEDGGSLEVINVSADLFHLFQIMRLDKHFTVKARAAA